MNTKTLYLLRGLPGSGKTTLANHLLELYGDIAASISADDYPLIYNDIGIFQSKHLPDAHSFCQKTVRTLMELNKPVIIIHNTFVTISETTLYLEMAKLFDYKTISLVVENINNTKSIHNVPEHVLNNMYHKFEVNLL